jgi:hypothetical protein
VADLGAEYEGENGIHKREQREKAHGGRAARPWDITYQNVEEEPGQAATGKGPSGLNREQCGE